MEAILFDIAKFLLSVSGGAVAGKFQNRKLTREVNLLKEENSQRVMLGQQQQTMIDDLQTNLLRQYEMNTHTQDELNEAKNQLIAAMAELEELRGKFHVLEFKSNADDNTIRALRQRVAELEGDLKASQERIEHLQQLLDEAREKINLLEMQQTR